MNIEITRDDLAHIIDKELNIYRGWKETQMLTEYLWDNGIIHEYSEIVEYCRRCWFFPTLQNAQHALGMSEEATWEDIKDREDVEYVDHESFLDVKLVILS